LGNNALRAILGNVNTDSRMVNSDSRKSGKVFTFNWIRCSRSTGMGVHIGLEYVRVDESVEDGVGKRRIVEVLVPMLDR
jgi:hypothetical protein